MRRPEILAVLWGKTPKTNNAWLPLTASWLAPGPEIVTFLVIPKSTAGQRDGAGYSEINPVAVIRVRECLTQ